MESRRLVSFSNELSYVCWGVFFGSDIFQFLVWRSRLMSTLNILAAPLNI